MPNILIIGATRGLGASLAKQYSSIPSNTVYATARSTPGPSSPSPHASNIHWLNNIDLTDPTHATTLTTTLQNLQAPQIDTLIITAGYFGLESFDDPSWPAQLTMYTTSAIAIAPVFLVQALVKSSLLKSSDSSSTSTSGAKIILVSSEAGSITLRHPREGGGNYGHHASKAALNMVGRLLALDLQDRGIAVAILHPGFMRTEMTKGVGFDRFWDEGGAVSPDVAAESLRSWVDEEFDLEKSGQFWAPRGSVDIGTAEPVLGTEVAGQKGPLRLPW
ncbi:oxidoreductase [Pseudovirgaria hyperparasitica]|uniref:Oxidoreductase n=1 Tax=Pseudovirgaria hyperparasitica TaxID=470096 RepID=A0A6A6VZG6_9PEZI|nr:oxidoreductase [Pseudovirgaria hyperparasitica]KAF2756042.1 oxidoreductase [Pseudovirgaria hyperparasitica]